MTDMLDAPAAMTPSQRCCQIAAILAAALLRPRPFAVPPTPPAGG
ncbi:MAG: hypothetical protein ACOC8H_00365 [bacterium]